MFSVTILTKNSERYLEKVLTSCSSCPEVIVLDTGSIDATCEIASQFSNVRLFHRPFIGFGPTHNIATSLASHDWILSLDSDEILTKELLQEIEAMPLDETAVYAIPRNNYYNGKHIKGCGWYPDRVKRLYNRTKTQFTLALVHETVDSTNMRVVTMHHALVHFPYNSVHSFLKKLDSYSTLFAEQHMGKKHVGFLAIVCRTAWSFFRSYFIKRGWLLGREGFEISVYNANSTFYKYIKLLEKNKLL